MSRAHDLLEKVTLMKKILHPIKSKEEEEKEEEERRKEHLKNGGSPLSWSISKTRKQDNRAVV